jgi:beta-carotene 15,15'-monooxygenase/beta,beta-carotene 9',10'-dioxygenase
LQINSPWINQFDFPVINERFRGRHYCIAYGLTAFDYSRMALVKKNMCDPSKDLVWTRQNHYSSEPWFLERPGTAA